MMLLGGQYLDYMCEDMSFGLVLVYAIVRVTCSLLVLLCCAGTTETGSSGSTFKSMPLDCETLTGLVIEA